MTRKIIWLNVAPSDHHQAGAGEQEGDPGVLGEPPGDRRGYHRGQAVAHRGHHDDQGEVAERRVAVAAGVEVVPVQQDRHEERDPEQDAVAANGPDGGRRARPPGQVTHAGGEPGRNVPQGTRQWLRRRFPGRARDRAGRAAWRPRQPGQEVAAPAATITITAALPWPPPSSRRRPTPAMPGDGGHDPADRRGHRVGHDELVIAHDVRQGRRQRGEKEAVHAQRRQRADVQRHAQFARSDQQGGDRHEGRPDERRDEQDLPPGPAVDEDPGERPDERIRQIKDGEGLRRRRRVRVGRRGEEHVGAEPGRVEAVASL